MLKCNRKTTLRRASLALFIYVSTHYVETVKKLDLNRYVQLSRWSRGNASECGAREAQNLILGSGMGVYVLLLLRLYYKN